MTRRIGWITMAVAMIILPAIMGWTVPVQGKDIYYSYSQLKAKQDKNIDYRITSHDGPLSASILAIHGGRIEIGTSQLAVAVAKKVNWDYYTFEGIKAKGNSKLHITSTRFDEPIALKLVAKSKKTVSLHGCTGTRAVTYIGGQDTKLGKKIEKHLEAAGFKVLKAPKRLDGKNGKNICNTNASGKGVQLEMTRELRESFFDGSKRTKTFYRYAEALSLALQ